MIVESSSSAVEVGVSRLESSITSEEHLASLVSFSAFLVLSVNSSILSEGPGDVSPSSLDLER